MTKKRKKKIHQLRHDTDEPNRIILNNTKDHWIVMMMVRMKLYNVF